jgi:hypothetical protein
MTLPTRLGLVLLAHRLGTLDLEAIKSNTTTHNLMWDLYFDWHKIEYWVIINKEHLSNRQPKHNG